MRHVPGGGTQIPQHRLYTAGRHALRFFGIANEGRHLMPAAQERVENCRADVPSGAREEDPHDREAVLYVSDRRDARDAATAL